MKVKWLGHSCFLIQSDTGIKIITDPYNTSQGIHYAPLKQTADIVTTSHDHFDHNAVESVLGKPAIVKQSGSITVKGIDFTGFISCHDTEGGKRRGNNIIFCFTVDKIRICHLGDLGHVLSNSQVDDIGKIDILLIPVGGYFTIDAEEAGQISERLQPKIIIPMHFKTEKLDFPIADVNDFIKRKNNVRKLTTDDLELYQSTLPTTPQIVVLKHAL